MVRPLGDALSQKIRVARSRLTGSLGVGVGGLEDVPLFVRPRPVGAPLDAAQAALAVGRGDAVAVGRRA